MPGPMPFTILCVDDHPDCRLSYALVLRQAGYWVREAANGEEALRLAPQADAVVLDVQLPDVSGLEVCRRLKTQPATELVPIILLSGVFIRTEDKVEGLEGGGDAYLTKPVEPRELLGQIKALLRVRQAELRARQAARQAQQEHRRLQLALQAGRLGTWELELSTGHLVSSEQCKAIFGLTNQDELTYDRLLTLIHRDDRDGVRAAIDRAVQGHANFQTEYRCIGPDGTLRWIATSGGVVCEPSGQAERLTGFTQDITARKDAEQSMARLAAIVVGSHDAIIGKTLEGTITSWNPAAERLYGYAVGEIIGQDIDVIIPTDRMDEQRSLIKRVLQGEPVAAFDTVRRHKSGRRIDVSVSVSPVFDHDGRVIGASTIARDITERRLLEEQFRQAQKMEAIGRLAGGVAHDFNNLLTVINGYGDIVTESLPAGHPAKELVGQIRDAGERAATLTRQLLAFSRKTVLEPKVLDLNTLVRQMESLLRRLIGEDIDLATGLAPDLGRVKVDPAQLEHVVVNLAINARDAMPQGGRLTVETQNTELDDDYAAGHAEVRAGSYVLLAVSDTGHGMDAATKVRIFEPFFTTKGPGKGTGLGLAMVYGFLKQSGGHVAVYSEPGRGTTFKLYLPRVWEAVTARASSYGSLPLPGGSETVLLVEDDEGMRTLVRHVLRGCGYTILEASHGQEALRVATQHSGPVHLLLTDVVMPGEMGGRQVAEAVRAAHPETRVLFASGYTDDAVVRHGVLEAEVPFLQKPFSPAALARKVREVLDGPI